ncbi:MAG: hypothetical protein LBD57_04390 [Endomicrobium sp.]|jgi:hypothetical protein|uniref:hypothetical protein n=1 Tax=Candidatus Endomicrobiellum cubanum TaxID=3242325 RepID=UPI00281D7450|nr:hypothetical protein [Endomicrobium sp.]
MDESTEKSIEQEYPTNSIIQTRRVNRAGPVLENEAEGSGAKTKVEKVVCGTVTTKKPSFKKRFANFFLGSDGKTVAEYVVQDIFVPAIKNTIVEVIYTVSNGIGDGFEMLFFGDRKAGRRSNMRRDGQKSYVSYNAQYSPGYDSIRNRRLRAESIVNRTRQNFDDIVLETRGEAEEVLSHLVDLIVDYGTASVADLYALAGINGEYTDNKYGWADLRGAAVVRVSNGYLLDLPRPILLD